MKLITRNFWWKLGSLAFAVLLWVAFLGEPELVTTHTAPILYKNLPQDLLIGADALDQVRVELRGPSGNMTPDRLSELAVFLDLSDVKGPGERTFTLADSDFRLPQGVSFLRSIPSQLRVRFSRALSREVPVRVQIGAQPPYGYTLKSWAVTPDTLKVAGPEQRVVAVQGAETDPLDLSRVTETADIKVSAYVNDAQVRFESAPVVTVHAVIEKNK